MTQAQLNTAFQELYVNAPFAPPCYDSEAVMDCRSVLHMHANGPKDHEAVAQMTDAQVVELVCRWVSGLL